MDSQYDASVGLWKRKQSPHNECIIAKLIYSYVQY